MKILKKLVALLVLMTPLMVVNAGEHAGKSAEEQKEHAGEAAEEKKEHAGEAAEEKKEHAGEAAESKE